MDTQQRQQTIRELLSTATPEQLRTALESVLDTTASAQRDRDVSDYGIDGWRSTEVVDAAHDARSNVGDEVDSGLLVTLRSGTGPRG